MGALVQWEYFSFVFSLVAAFAKKPKQNKYKENIYVYIYIFFKTTKGFLKTFGNSFIKSSCVLLPH